MVHVCGKSQQRSLRMAEAKSRQFMINIEPTLYDLLQGVLNDENVSASGFMRCLLIQALYDRKLLTEEHMLTMLGVQNASH
jgi:hypothetical protein